MTEQQRFEVIKALAYGETPEQVAAAEGLSVDDVRKVQTQSEDEIAEEQAILRKAGYIYDD